MPRSSILLPGQKLSRRTLLRSASATLALPILDAMLPTTVKASSTRRGNGTLAPRRMAFLMVPNGMFMPSWTPKATGTDFDISYTLEPLRSLKDHLLILSGLTQHNANDLGDGGGDHARSAAAWLTGCHCHKTSGADIRSGVSADQIAARYLGRMTRFPSLELGAEHSGMAGDCDSGYSCSYSSTISWRTATTPVAKETNPRSVFDRLFGTGDGMGNAIERARRQVEDGSILDAITDDATALQKQLGSHDRQKLDEYFTSVREIEQRVRAHERDLLSTAPVQAAQSHLPDVAPPEIGEHIRLMGDMMVLAFQTDQTRVATFMFANEASNRSYTEIGVPEGHHECSHHDGSKVKQDKVQRINQYHTTQLAYILNKMQGIQEADGTLLDNSLIVYGAGISDGNRHNHDDLPILVAGGKGMVRSGRHIAYRDGTPMTNLFMTVFDRMGIPTEEIGSIGDSNGTLAQLF